MKLGPSADEVLTTTRAVRRRIDLDRPVERHVIRECLETALQAHKGDDPVRQAQQQRVMDSARYLLGISYSEVTQVALIPVGHTKGADVEPARREPLDEVPCWDSWSPS